MSLSGYRVRHEFPLRRLRRSLRAGGRVALAVLAIGAGAVHAQLLADVMVATAISATFDSSVRFPSGSLSASGPAVDSLIASLPDAGAWTDWEVYVARGIAANLQAGFVHNVITSFAVAGYFEVDRSQSSVASAGGTQTRTRVQFEGVDGSSRVLYLIGSGQEVAWLTARSR